MERCPEGGQSFDEPVKLVQHEHSYRFAASRPVSTGKVSGRESRTESEAFAWWHVRQCLTDVQRMQRLQAVVIKG
jgi:hypothetical protein